MIGDNEILITAGVRSPVYSHDIHGNPKGAYGRYGIGHVTLIDLDKKYRHIPDIKLALDKWDIDGPTLIIESSEGSYHLINLTVRSFTEIPEIMNSMDGDSKHIEIGLDRGWWRIRVGPKLTLDDNIYKPQPEVIGTHTIPTDSAVSSPHTELFRKLHGLDDGWFKDYTFVGNTIEVNQYVTFSDYGKALQRRVK